MSAQAAPASQAAEASPGKPLALKSFTKQRSRSSKRTRSKSRKTVASPAKSKETQTSAAAETPSTKANSFAAELPKDAPLANKDAASKSISLDDSVANARAEVQGKSGSKSAGQQANKDPASKEQSRVPASAAVPAGMTTGSAEMSPPPAQATGNEGPAPQKIANDVPSSATPAATGTTTGNVMPTPSPNTAAPSAGSEASSANATAPVQVMSATTASAESVSGTDPAWDRTSLIGKIFVAFGGLLTLASAARMFIA